MSTSYDIASDYLEYVWNQGRTDLAEKYVAEDLIQHNANLADGRAALVTFIEGARSQMPDMKFDVRRSAAEGDLVFVHSHFIPAPGQTGLSVIDVFRVSDGLIVEHWAVRDDLRAMVPAGVVAPPGPPG